MNKKKRFYSKEFKEHAVLLSYQRDNLKELAHELGVHVERIYKWRAQALPPGKAVANEFSSNKTRKLISDGEEVKQLRKELKETKLELEILKKAVHIFSKSDGNTTNL
jgi:transposase